MKTWQVLMIGGPAFMLGLVVCYMFMRGEVRRLESLLMDYLGIPADSVYGRKP